MMVKKHSKGLKEIIARLSSERETSRIFSAKLTRQEEGAQFRGILPRSLQLRLGVLL